MGHWENQKAEAIGSDIVPSFLERGGYQVVRALRSEAEVK